MPDKDAGTPRVYLARHGMLFPPFSLVTMLDYTYIKQPKKEECTKNKQ